MSQTYMKLEKMDTHKHIHITLSITREGFQAGRMKLGSYSLRDIETAIIDACQRRTGHQDEWREGGSSSTMDRGILDSQKTLRICSNPSTFSMMFSSMGSREKRRRSAKNAFPEEYLTKDISSRSHGLKSVSKNSRVAAAYAIEKAEKVDRDAGYFGLLGLNLDLYRSHGVNLPPDSELRRLCLNIKEILKSLPNRRANEVGIIEGILTLWANSVGNNFGMSRNGGNLYYRQASGTLAESLLVLGAMLSRMKQSFPQAGASSEYRKLRAPSQSDTCCSMRRALFFWIVSQFLLRLDATSADLSSWLRGLTQSGDFGH
ncbi:hypothetical protein N431DRAFT_454392 [Stipitochalara longipes BDJ]|nr:hypothetical protein N431DRAFT_454392 [Stipitochalara longipes BDJ]